MDQANQNDLDVEVVIANYHSAQLAIDCLRSIERERESFPELFVTVVDNASTDQSVANLEDAVARFSWQNKVRLHPQANNGGAAAGTNIALTNSVVSRADYFWLLNTDTNLRPGALAGLLEVMAEQPRVGIADSRRVAGFGWECWFAANSCVVHLVEQSTGVTNPNQTLKRPPRYGLESSRRRYFASHHGHLYALLADLAAGSSAMINRATAVLRDVVAKVPAHLVRDIMAEGLSFTAVFGPSEGTVPGRKKARP